MSTAQRELAARLAELDAGETITAIGRCPIRGCRTHARLDVDADELRAGVYCVAHRLRLRFARLRVTHAPGVACTSSCWHAVSASCRCSCNGANHGLKA